MDPFTTFPTSPPEDIGWSWLVTRTARGLLLRMRANESAAPSSSPWANSGGTIFPCSCTWKLCAWPGSEQGLRVQQQGSQLHRRSHDHTRRPCSEPGQAQSSHVHEHGNMVPPELAHGDELGAADSFALIRSRRPLAVRVTSHDHPMSSGGLVGKVVKGSIDLRRVEAVAGFNTAEVYGPFYDLPDKSTGGHW